MTDDERTRLAKMEEKIDSVDKRVERIEGKFDAFLAAEAQKHLDLMNHFSSETSKIAVEFGKQLSELDGKKANSWVEQALKWAIGAIVGGVFVAVGYAIIYAYSH